MTNVLIADDHAIVRQGIQLNLSIYKNINIVGEAAGGIEALELVKTLAPDLLITDISMPDMSGIEVAREVVKNFPKTKVLMLSTHNEEEYILESFAAGASGYLPKDSSVDQLNKAIETIVSGQVFYTEAVSKIITMATINNRSPIGAQEQLTERELEVLEQIVDGLTNKEIANKLFISVRTVDAHRRNIMSKLNASNSAELVKLSYEKKLIKRH
ncbi:MAG: response regulator transcription factor [Cyclobacteriaceae bacterium]